MLKEEAVENEMSFLDHLEELRWHLIRAAICVGVVSIAAFVNMRYIFREIILGPAKTDFWTYRMMCRISDVTCVDSINFTLQSRELTGQFVMHFTAALTIGFIASFPYIFYEFWKFIKPGLYPTERKNASGTVFFVSVLFFIGILFGYFIIAPLSINFLANYRLDDMIEIKPDVTSYIGTLCMIVLSGGLMFQLPVIVFVLSKLGLMTPAFMRKYRRHAIVVLMIIAAVITPSPDVLSQMLVGLPLYILYELSIFVSASAVKQKKA